MELSQGKRLSEALNNMKRTMGRPHHTPGLSQGEFFMLKAISELKDRDGNIKMSSITTKLNISNPAVSQMISGLEEKELVKRTVCKSDRRVVFVNLTNHGEDILAHAACMFDGIMDTVVAKLGKEDSEQLITLINKLYNSMKEGNE